MAVQTTQQEGDTMQNSDPITVHSLDHPVVLRVCRCPRSSQVAYRADEDNGAHRYGEALQGGQENRSEIT